MRRSRSSARGPMRVISSASSSDTPSRTIAKQPAASTALRLGDHPGTLIVVAALGLEPAVDMNRLRAQTDMPHDRNATLDQEGDGAGECLPGLDLDRLAAGLLHHPDGRRVGLFGRALERSERQIDDDQRVGRSPHHRLAMQDHHLQRHGGGGRQPVDDHADRIADQKDIDMRIEQRRDRRGVGRQTDDLRTAFKRLNGGHGDPARQLLFRH